MMNTDLSNDLQQLQMELRAQNFDIIRFSTYRTACKLRFIQKKLHFHHLDLLNVIESLREAFIFLSTIDQSFLLSTSHLTKFLTSIYTNLNKRLPFPQQILHIDHCVRSAIAWLFSVYQSQKNTSIHFHSYRVVLILLCTGKLIDKMHHLFNFSLISSNTLTCQQVNELLHDILALPYSLQEISATTYEKSVFSYFPTSINLNQFLDLLIYNSTTNCLQWLIIFDRLISVENVIHRVKCSVCQRPSFSGFRYKCQQCQPRSYQLCQDCFWRGRTSNQHLSTHEMKEYTFCPTNRHSIRKSFQCMPKNDKSTRLSSPLTIDNEKKSDEHKQIASYSQDLASLVDQPFVARSRRDHYDKKRAEKKLTIAKLEAENRRILHEINTLRSQIKHQSLEQLVPNHSTYRYNRTDSLERNHYVRNRYVDEEIQLLFQRKQQLEFRIQQLQQSREELTSQLDDLGEVLQRKPSLNTRISTKHQTIRSYSTPTTPIHHLRTDLLLAADSLTSAMSSLVQQLNTERYDRTVDDFFSTTDDDDDKYEDYDILRKLDDIDNLKYFQ